MKILTVESDEKWAEKIKNRFGKSEELVDEIHIFEDFNKALSSFEEKDYQLIISESLGNEEEALDFYLSLEEKGDVSFIFYTYDPSKYFLRRGLNEGINGFVEKTEDREASLDELEAMVKKEIKSLLKEEERKESQQKFREIFNNIVKNVAERREAEKALQNSKDKIKKMHKLAADFATCEDREEVYERAVKATKEIIELDVSAFLECDDGDYEVIKKYSKKGDAQELIEKIIEKQRGMLEEVIYNRETKLIDDLEDSEAINFESERYHSLMILPVYPHGVLVGLSIDREHFVQSDLEYIELLIDHMSESLKRIMIREREEFFHSLLRHDVANKIRATEGFLDLLEGTDLEPTQEEYAKNARIGVKEAMRIIEKVRMFKKLREIERSEVKLDKTLNRVKDAMQPMASKEDIEIKLDELSGEDVIAGPLLEEVISNIIENSIRHSGGTLVIVNEEVKDDKVKLTIEDDGVGIPDDEKNKIFNRGYKKGENAGSGLGMYFVKQILDSYDSSIEIKDSSLGGARFEIILDKAVEV